MLFKVDENLHSEVAEMLRQNSHDAHTVWDEGLRGDADRAIAQVCRQEKRALLTLDLDFSNIRAYPPQDHAGIIVLRLVDQSRPAVQRVIQRLLPLFGTEPLAGNPRIVDETQVRIRQGTA